MIDTTSSIIRYAGNGAQTVFPVPFPFPEAAHIRAHATDEFGASRALKQGADYTVARNAGGTGELVILGDPPPAGSTLTVRRLLPMTQEVFFHNQGPNSPKAIEDAVDKLTMLSQQLQAEIDDAVLGPGAAEADNAARIEAVEHALSLKAESAHTHAQNAIPGLVAALAQKADAAATAQALGGKASLVQLAEKADLTAVAAKADRAELAGKADLSALAQKADAAALAAKADKTELAGKAGSVHSHTMDAVNGLSAALAAKLDADDPRLGLIGSAPGGGGATDHAALTNRDAAGQHPQSAILNLTDDLAAVRGDMADLALADKSLGDSLAAVAVRLGGAESGVAQIAPLAGRVTEAEVDLSALNADVTTVENSVAALDTRVGSARDDASSALARLEELRAAVEELRALAENPVIVAPPPSGGGGAIVGEIRLLPFRPASLPSGWYFCNGGLKALSSPQGGVLSAFPEEYKTDWGIAVTGTNIRLPNLFDPESGGGLFLRAVNGSARLPGAAQGDAIRNITGTWTQQSNVGPAVVAATNGARSVFSGAFKANLPASKGYSFSSISYGVSSSTDLGFDASLVVPTAEENRPVNVGMTPAVYLGV